MTTQWNTVMKRTFLTQLLALSPKETYQVTAKVALLMENPLPDGNTRKQIKRKYNSETVYAMRSGNFRIRYTLKNSCIGLLDVKRRSEHNYDEAIDDGFGELELGNLDFDTEDDAASQQPDWERLLAPKMLEKRPLPEPITEELLARLHVPRECYTRLLRIKTEDDLLNCPGVPDEILLKIHEYMFEQPLSQVVQQPDYVLNNPSDLIRFKEGELLTFLLKLSPEQEKFANWSSTISGPTLVKGGPGTGKSTVALHRIRSLIENLRKQGRLKPRILFTTYTNALVRSSEQQLLQLLGQDADCVVVRTADKVATDILSRAGVPSRTPRNYDPTSKLIREAVGLAQFEGNALQQEFQRRMLEHIGYDYLLEEIGKVIVARQLNSAEAYETASRSGRKVRLTPMQRRVIWRIYEKFVTLLEHANVETWEQMRARADAAVTKDSEFQSYDAVVIDEAQDLDPSMLRLLIKLCKSPERIFVTADANQSIYGSSFTWTDVHESLKFRGRTGILRANYRSTRETGEAAQSYLAYGILDSEPVERVYVNNGLLPVVRLVGNSREEVDLLTRFLPIAARECRLSINSCAVFCPTEATGRTIVSGLIARGIEASFMSGRELDLSRRGVKVLTLKSSKGLEFPVVALAGFVDAVYPVIPLNASEDEQEEILTRERRTMFVGMTRAMRALLVIVPMQAKSPLLEGFDEKYWNAGK
jgi:superfamily I DNA/RNA helicase/mRNA-degrading endonuclease RelE of RelBE toxin-antitoxin system